MRHLLIALVVVGACATVDVPSDDGPDLPAPPRGP